MRAAMNDDEAKTVAAVAGMCSGRADLDRWGLIMRLGRLFTPDPQAGLGLHPDDPHSIAWNAYQRSVDLGLLYAEGFVFSGHFATEWAWCLDGEAVVDPERRVPATAYFGVAVRPEYARRVHEARQRYLEGRRPYRWMFPGVYEAVNPPLEPAADLAGSLGRDIEAAVRGSALAQIPAGAPITGPYARFVIRRVSRYNIGIALVCNGPGGAFRDNATILDEQIQDGDSLATLMRMADEHRARCECGEAREEEPVAPDQTAYRPAEVRLRENGGGEAEREFAVLRRIEYHTWHAWLHPADPAARGTAPQPPVRVTRNAVSYEVALAAVFRAMGERLPAQFATGYVAEEPGPDQDRAPFVATPEQWAAPWSRMPISYERYLIRSTPGGLSTGLRESGQTGGVNSRDGAIVQGIGDGTSLAVLIRAAEEHMPVDPWSVCPEDERVDPESTVQKRSEVHLCWGQGGEQQFAQTHRLDDGTWGAWIYPAQRAGETGVWEEPEPLISQGVSYEMALAAVFQSMGEAMPTGFGLNYL
jgi:hypothetical protein